uniref:Phosphomevalonate kinase n=1 Tax=Strigamia maritima TaxID=126957 RepID=T1JES9_STRMM
MAHNPYFVLLISGKRKCGKDYLAEKLVDLFGHQHLVCKITISEPLKAEYANIYGLDSCRLMESSAYKEEFRTSMIKWGEKIRSQDPGYFCRKAIEQTKAIQFPIWVITDIRRQTDLDYFQNSFGDKVKTVRITAEDNIRQQRHWAYTHGVDDAESECDLDNVSSWNWIVNNSGNDIAVMKTLQEIKDKAQAIVPPFVYNMLQ